MRLSRDDDPAPEGTGAGSFFTGLLLLLCLAIVPALAVLRLEPPPPAPVAAAQGAFSARRALVHVREIAQRPHPAGSRDHERVRAYLLAQLTALGLEPQVQTATVFDDRFSPRVAVVRNVLVRLRGDGSEGAVLLACHYDSVPTAPGAGDDAAGVAAVLETLRALRSAPPLRRDIIVLFSDAEELGLLGAKVFVERHPWARDVRLALNFEARGAGGPSLLFETSAGNLELIRAFARVAPHPVSTSLAYDVYKILPNDTDFSVFREAGIPGMNFAFIRDLSHYHTARDNTENLQWGSLQQQGEYALSLARHFGDMGLPPARGGNAVYFNVAGHRLVVYSTALSLPLTLATFVLLGIVVTFGRARGAFTGRELLSALFAASGVPVAAVGVGSLLQTIMAAVSGWLGGVGLYQRSDLLCFLAVVLMTLAAVAAWTRWMVRRWSAAAVTVGAAALFALPLPFAIAYLPGGSYLLLWPLIGFVIGAAATVYPLRSGTGRAAPLAAGALPTLLLAPPVIYLLFVALSLEIPFAIAVFLILGWMLLPLLPLIHEIVSRRLPLVPLSLVAAALLMSCGIAATRPGADKPTPVSLRYLLDADSDAAFWMTPDKVNHTWTASVLGPSAMEGKLPRFFPPHSRFADRIVRYSPAAPLDLRLPEATLVSDERDGGERTVRIRLTSPRTAEVLAISVSTDARIVAVGGTAIPPASQPLRGLPIYAPPAAGVPVTVRCPAGRPVRIEVQDHSFALPLVAPPRPPATMPSLPGDGISVIRTFSF